MENYRFNISITEKCNLRCPHCYTARKKGSLTLDKVDTIVGNLEDGLTRVKIEGGEVYSERELFYHTIKKFRERFGEAEIRVNTNGVAFYKTRESIIEEADRLHSMGVSRLRVSLDKFHEDGGADLDRVKAIGEVLDGVGHPLEVRYMSLTQAVPIGTAESLPEDQKEKRDCMNSQSDVDNPYFFVDIRGDLYTCCWKLIPPIGNLFISRLGDLYAGMGEIQRRLLAGDVVHLATTPDLRRLGEEKGECMLCKEVFGRGE